MNRLAYCVASIAFLCAILAAPGCAKKADGPPTDDKDILHNLVSQVPDSSGNAKSFKAFFAKDGTVPDETERKRFEKLLFKGVGDPSITGDTATQKVEVRDDDAGQTLGQVAWTFVKENSQWKLKTAPLP